jgi:glycosyltransferase involved in cell wall biosynthesis
VHVRISLRVTETPRSGGKILVVDDGSNDGSAQRIRAAGEELLELPSNQGYVRAANAGLSAALSSRPDFVLLLNNDVTVAATMVEKLRACMQEDSTIGIAGPVMLFESRPEFVWAAGGTLDPITGWTRHRGLGRNIGSMGMPIADVPVDDDDPWPRRHLATIEQAYAPAAHLERHRAALRDFYGRKWTHLVPVATASAEWLAHALGIRTPFRSEGDRA